jgi:multifunctional methyltransferase subunit TRM112
MRLLTHNTLKSLAKEAVNGSALQLQVEHMEVRESECNEEFIRHVLPSLNWDAFVLAASAVGFDTLPPEPSDDLLMDSEFLRAAHHLLLDVHIVQGALVCTETGTVYPIENGLPNMMYAQSTRPQMRAHMRTNLAYALCSY